MMLLFSVRRLLCAATMLLIPVVGMATDYHILPKGAGEQTGANWQNARPASELESLLTEQLQPGDRVLLGSGTYGWRPRGRNTLLVLRRGGTADKPITLAGVDSGGGLPVVVGKWQESNARYHAHSSAAISLADGVDHVRIGNLRINRFMHGVNFGGANRNIHLRDIEITRCREGITLDELSDSTIEGCRITHYTKRGIRLESNCHDLLIKQVHTDATGGDAEWPIEGYPFGFSVEDEGNHDIAFVGCSARNNIHRRGPGDYWNGDGFCVELEARRISYRDCLSIDNADGGWDDKSLAPSLVNCVAMRNKRNFRLWNIEGDADHPARLQNCLGVESLKRGGSGSSCCLWLCGPVLAEFCTFHNGESFVIGIESNDPGGALVARNCILSADSSVGSEKLVLREGGAEYQAEDVAEWIEGKLGDDPRYVAPSKDFSGSPADAYDSRRYGEAKGYFADRDSPSP